MRFYAGRKRETQESLKLLPGVFPQKSVIIFYHGYRVQTLSVSVIKKIYTLPIFLVSKFTFDKGKAIKEDKPKRMEFFQ